MHRHPTDEQCISAMAAIENATDVQIVELFRSALWRAVEADALTSIAADLEDEDEDTFSAAHNAFQYR